MKRPGTSDDSRDIRTPKTPPRGVALQLARAPDFVEEDLTGRIDISEEEKAALRAQRPEDKRLLSLEKWRTESTKWQLEVTGTLGKVDGKLDTLSQFLGMKTAEDGKTARAKITTNGKVLIAIVTAAIGALVTILTLVLK